MHGATMKIEYRSWCSCNVTPTLSTFRNSRALKQSGPIIRPAPALLHSSIGLSLVQVLSAVRLAIVFAETHALIKCATSFATLSSYVQRLWLDYSICSYRKLIRCENITLL